MSKGAIIGVTIIVILCILLVGLFIFFNFTTIGIETWNSWTHTLKDADNRTNYNTLKKVEDTCRAMISSYESDRLKYEQFKDSDNELEREIAIQAKIRANDTASSYNNYIIKNKHVWKDAVPDDIYMELRYLE